MNSVISPFKIKRSNTPCSTTVSAGSNVPTPDCMQNGDLAILGATKSNPRAPSDVCQCRLPIPETVIEPRLHVVVVAEDIGNVYHPAVDSAAASTDTVDYCAPALVRLSCVKGHSNDNMNGKANHTIISPNPLSVSPVPLPDDDDDSDNSTVACISTSSSSEYSNSTVVQSPTTAVAKLQTCSLWSSNPGEISDEHRVECTSTEDGSFQMRLAHTAMSKGHGDYMTHFSNTPPVSLPLCIQSRSVSSNCITHSTNSRLSNSSAASTPKHVRSTGPRLTRGLNQSMPSVHGRPNLSVVPTTVEFAGTQASGITAKSILKHERNLSLDYR